MNLIEAIIRQATETFESRERDEAAFKRRAAELEAEGRRIVSGGQVCHGDDPEYAYEFTDYRTGEILAAGTCPWGQSHQGIGWQRHWYHEDAIADETHKLNEPIDDLPDWLANEIIYQADEYPEELRAWLATLK